MWAYCATAPPSAQETKGFREPRRSCGASRSKRQVPYNSDPSLAGSRSNLAGDRIAALGMLAGGATLMLLRLHTDALWMPVGYHWAWNVLRTAIFGAADSAPSIRSLRVHGPERWMGKPGEPEPGLLSTLVHLAMALLIWLWMWRAEARRGRESAA